MTPPSRKPVSTADNQGALVRDWLNRKLLSWFREHQRDLPWRENRDPYRIWISEVMLQQTQVATVIPYFNRFIATFPTVQSLAQADEQDVLHLWSGLGYYRRARHLHQAAQQIVADHEGIFPTDPQALATLPGMGRYTVNAVLSQAFDQRLPILEANSQRLLCRLFARAEDPRKEPLKSWLWKTAEEILPRRKHIGEMNQALMELGSLVCTFGNPACGTCPLRAKCETRKQGAQNSIPFRPKPPEIITVKEVALIIRKKKKVLLAQRPETADRWARMWECPHVALENGESHADAALRLLKTIGLEATIGSTLITIRHGVTRYAITMVCVEAMHQGGRLRKGQYAGFRWLSLDELGDVPVSSPQRRLIEAIQNNE